MCWIGKLDTTAKIAEKDIEVFKICRPRTKNTCVSWFRNFRYKKGETYEHPINIDETELFLNIDEGIHSYILNIDIERSDDIYLSLTLDNKFICIYPNDVCYVKCIIPKGSTYFINERGEVVSDAIKILEITLLKNIKQVCIN